VFLHHAPLRHLSGLFSQAGSGKSHAVLGSSAAPGLVPRLADHFLHLLCRHNARLQPRTAAAAAEPSTSGSGGGAAAAASAFATLACVEVGDNQTLRDLLPYGRSGGPTAASPRLKLTESAEHGVRLDSSIDI
jgi:hypothetical protein